MTSTQELLSFDGLELNDGALFSIEDGTFNFTPAKKQANWIDNPDTDGSALAYEPNYSNAEFAFSVRVEPKPTMDLALEAFGEIQAKLQKASKMRDQGGLPLLWTPAGSSKAYTWYAKLGELTDLPVTVQGDLAGWFVNAPVIPVKITCRPFGYRPERVVLTPATSATPLQVVELPEVGGDVPAEGRAILSDKSAVDRRHLEWGLDQNSGPTLITAASLSTTGFTGALKTRAGAYSAEKVIRGLALAQATPLFSTPALASLGSYRVKLRVYASSATVRFRALYRSGDGPWKTLPAVAPPVINSFAEIDCGEVTFEEVAAGSQRSEVKVEPFTTEGAVEVDVNYLALIPTTSGWGKARGMQDPNPSALLAYDEFNQEPSGNLEGKALPFGGNWTEASKTGANGFQIDAVNHQAVRTTVSDASPTGGCYAIAGATNYDATQVSAIVGTSAVGFGRMGVFARYANVSNWLMAAVLWEPGVGGSGRLNWLVEKCVAAAVSEIDGGSISGQLIQPVTVSLQVAADGTYRASFAPFTTAIAEGQDPDLAAGGALASGKPGVYDVWTSASACTRTVDAFSVSGGANAGRVLYASRKAEIRADLDDPVQRQDASGVYYGAPNSYRGDRLEIPVAGDVGAVSRLAVKLRRNDVDLEPDSNVTDNQELEVRIAERFLAPR